MHRNKEEISRKTHSNEITTAKHKRVEIQQLKTTSLSFMAWKGFQQQQLNFNDDGMNDNCMYLLNVQGVRISLVWNFFGLMSISRKKACVSYDTTSHKTKRRQQRK